ncbi:MAG: chloride channel protein [Promethearchaeota archaeon]
MGAEMADAAGYSRRVSSGPPSFPTITALGTVFGLVGGLVGVFVRWVVLLLKSTVVRVHAKGGPWLALVFFLPLLGAALGSLASRGAPEIKGSGIPELLMLVKLGGGKGVPARVPLLKAIATPLHIGLGAAGGVEGPIAQVGGSFASLLGDRLGLNRRGRTLLVACGMTGGVSATFNAPLGGTFFGVEILYNFSTLLVNTLVPLALASVVATTISWLVFGFEPVVSVPQFTFEGMFHLPVYALLGLLIGLFGVAWVRFFSSVGETFYRWRRVPATLKPVLGALPSAVALVFFVDLIDLEHGTLEGIIGGKYSLPLMSLGLMALSVAAAAAVGSGGTAGLFSPSLMMGALFGGIFGLTVNAVSPGFLDDPFKMALVGSAAFFGGMARSPLTNVLLVFELTLNYGMVLPLMSGVVVSYLVHWRVLGDETLYTTNIMRRYQLPPWFWRRISIRATFAEMKVERLMTTRVQLLTLEMTREQVAECLRTTRFNAFPVVDAEDTRRLVGTARSVEVHKLVTKGGGVFDLREALSPTNPVIFPNDSAFKALEMFNSFEVPILVVVDSGDPDKVVGVLSRKDLLLGHLLREESGEKSEY